MNCSKSISAAYPLLIAVSLFFVFGTASGQKKAKLDPEVVVSRHLQSIGSAEALAAAMNRSLLGNSNFKDIRNSIVDVDGTAQFTSSSGNVGMHLVFSTRPSDDYRQEKIDYDGRRLAVAFATSTRRSPLGQFVFENPEMFKNGLFGGTLNTGWALMADKSSKIRKLDFHGYEKVDGTELIVLRCSISGSNLAIKLYFDPETFDHVRTTYAAEIQPPVTISDEGRVSAIKHLFIETFARQMPVNGLRMPTVYKINYMYDSSSRSGQLEWTMNFSRFEFKKQ